MWRSARVATAALLLSCASQVAVPASQEPDAVPTPSTETHDPSAAPRQVAAVVRVVDGDTIRVRLDGREVTVRYIGIDTPETVDPRRPVQCFGREAAEHNARLVAGRTVELERDVSETDSFGRLLRYVYVDGVMVNQELVRAGYASAVTYPPDVKHQERLRALEAEARAAARGLWAPGACATPSPSPTPSPAGAFPAPAL